jgi:hypothetical protein
MLDDNRKIGIFLTAIGLIFTLIGILFFFDRGFLAIGNIAFLAGTALIIGLRKTSRFFFQWHKLRGSIFFFTGIFLIIFLGYTFIGLLVEAFGFVSLFGDIIPVALVVARQLPIIGTILSHPLVSRWVDRADNASLPV